MKRMFRMFWHTYHKRFEPAAQIISGFTTFPVSKEIEEKEANDNEKN